MAPSDDFINPVRKLCEDTRYVCRRADKSGDCDDRGYREKDTFPRLRWRRAELRTWSRVLESLPEFTAFERLGHALSAEKPSMHRVGHRGPQRVRTFNTELGSSYRLLATSSGT